MARLFDKKKKLNGRKGKADMKNSKFNLEELSFQFGIYQNQEGYPILLSAVDLGRTEPDRLRSLTKRFYPEVGRRCGCTGAAVERSLRSAIAKGWSSNPELFTTIAERPITQPPTAGDFLCMILHYLQEP